MQKQLIVSTAKAAMVICKMWDRKYHRVPDFVVVEGPLAGGHLGFTKEQLTQYGADSADVEKTYDQAAYDEEVKARRNTIPISRWLLPEAFTPMRM